MDNIIHKDEGKEVLEINEKDFKKLKLEEKEAIRSKLAQSYLVRLNTLSKWQTIFIGIAVTALIPSLILFLQNDSTIWEILLLIAGIIILFLYLLKYHKALKQKEEFGNWVRTIEKTIREDLKNKLNKKIKKEEGKYPVQFPIKY